MSGPDADEPEAIEPEPGEPDPALGLLRSVRPQAQQPGSPAADADGQQAQAQQ